MIRQDIGSLRYLKQQTCLKLDPVPALVAFLGQLLRRWWLLGLQANTGRQHASAYTGLSLGQIFQPATVTTKPIPEL